MFICLIIINYYEIMNFNSFYLVTYSITESIIEDNNEYLIKYNILINIKIN